MSEATVASVQGIGGVFIESEDATALASWYERILGIELETHPAGTGYYHVFSTRDLVTSVVRENPVLAINQSHERLARTGRGFVLNLRVDDLAEFLDQLRSLGIEVEDRILEWERGKHGWIHDPDGNRIELYEEILAEPPESRPALR